MITDYRSSIIGCRLLVVDYPLPNIDRRLSTRDYRLLSFDYRLPIIDCWLPLPLTLSCADAVPAGVSHRGLCSDKFRELPRSDHSGKVLLAYQRGERGYAAGQSELSPVEPWLSVAFLRRSRFCFEQSGRGAKGGGGCFILGKQKWVARRFVYFLVLDCRKFHLNIIWAIISRRRYKTVNRRMKNTYDYY